MAITLFPEWRTFLSLVVQVSNLHVPPTSFCLLQPTLVLLILSPRYDIPTSSFFKHSQDVGKPVTFYRGYRHSLLTVVSAFSTFSALFRVIILKVEFCAGYAISRGHYRGGKIYFLLLWLPCTRIFPNTGLPHSLKVKHSHKTVYKLKWYKA